MSREGKLLVVVIEPGKTAKPFEVENTLQSFANVIGGEIETSFLGPDFVLLTNKQGKKLGLPFNRRYVARDIYGPFII